MLRAGRFGPYVTDGTTNASLRQGDDQETITHERAVELLADRRAAGPPVKRAKRAAKAKKATKKATAKKAAKATKKATAAKTAKSGQDDQGGQATKAVGLPWQTPDEDLSGDGRGAAGSSPSKGSTAAGRPPRPGLAGRAWQALIGTAEPGATALGAALPPCCSTRPPPVTDRTEALLLAADRAQHVAEVVAPALGRRTVGGDRPFLGIDPGLPGIRPGPRTPGELRRLVDWAPGGVEPDLNVLVDVPLDDGPPAPAGPGLTTVSRAWAPASTHGSGRVPGLGRGRSRRLGGDRRERRPVEQVARHA